MLPLKMQPPEDGLLASGGDERQVLGGALCCVHIGAL